MLVISTQNWSILAKFAPKKSSEIGCFLLIVSWRSFPPKFPVKLADFSQNLPRNLIWLFSAKIPQNRPILLRMLTFLPRKSCEIGRFFREFAPKNPAKVCLFFRDISEALSQSENLFCTTCSLRKKAVSPITCCPLLLFLGRGSLAQFGPQNSILMWVAAKFKCLV